LRSRRAAAGFSFRDNPCLPLRGWLRESLFFLFTTDSLFFFSLCFRFGDICSMVFPQKRRGWSIFGPPRLSTSEALGLSGDSGAGVLFFPLPAFHSLFFFPKQLSRKLVFLRSMYFFDFDDRISLHPVQRLFRRLVLCFSPLSLRCATRVYASLRWPG